MKTKARLFTAYEWTCEECGRNNFESCVHAELPPDERAELFRRAEGLSEFELLPDGWMDMELVTIPDEVKCQHCGEEFETVDDRTYDE